MNECSYHEEVSLHQIYRQISNILRRNTSITIRLTRLTLLDTRLITLNSLADSFVDVVSHEVIEEPGNQDDKYVDVVDDKRLQKDRFVVVYIFDYHTNQLIECATTPTLDR